MTDDENPICPEHNTRRTVVIEIAVIYGILIALAIWNWWPA